MIFNILLIGFIATFIADVLQITISKICKTPSPNFNLVGRWFLYMFKGKYNHHNIFKSPTLFGENTVGWFIHYLIGALLALIMFWIYSLGFIKINLYLYALVFGICTVVFPFFIMQPAFGFGYAASKTPTPMMARTRSLLGHLYFGIGLSIAWLFVNIFV